MGWWKSFKAWLNVTDFEAQPEDWQPSTYLFDTYHRPTPAECSDEKPTLSDVAVTATPDSSSNGASDPVSDESNASGDDAWFWAETDEEKAPEVIELEHADHLPDSTYRVFPTATNHRNVYDSPTSVKRAVAARKSWSWEPLPTRVYRAETVWRDVTDEFVRP